MRGAGVRSASEGGSAGRRAARTLRIGPRGHKARPGHPTAQRRGCLRAGTVQHIRLGIVGSPSHRYCTAH